MRYVEITHTYVIPVPAQDVSVIEPLAREGMSIMEGFMSARAANMRDLRSDWKLMPKEYRPQQLVQGNGDQDTDEITMTPAKRPEFMDTPRNRDRAEAKRQIEMDIDQGINFSRDVMGQSAGMPPHPWDQGIRITPLDHEMAIPETIALAQEGKLCGEVEEATQMICVGVKGHGPGFHVWVPREEQHGRAAEGDWRDGGGNVEGSPRELEAGADGDPSA